MKKKIVPFIMCGALLASAVPAQAAWTVTTPSGSQKNTANTSYSGYSSVFTDIGGHWAQKYIEQWAENGVFGGMGNGQFSPNTTLTRAQFASVLSQLFDLQMVTKESPVDYKLPSDVASSHWGRKAIAVCLDNGIMNTRNGGFAPDMPITREEVFFSLGKAAKLDTLNVNSTSALNRFNDATYISSAARNVIGKMVSLGMLAGRGNNMLEPQATITRAEVSTILTKAVNYVNQSSVRNESYSNTAVFNVDKGKNLTLTKVKVTGNMFIKGSDIDTITLNNINVSGTVYIYADSVETINLTDVTDTDFVIIGSDITFDGNDDSDGNTFTFKNANTVEFNGEADEVSILGEFLDKIVLNGNAGDGIASANVDTLDGDKVAITLSGKLKEVEINGDATINGYGKVQTLYLDGGNYDTTMVGDKTKVVSGKLKLAGNTYTRGTYARNEMYGAVTPNVSQTGSNSSTTGLTYMYKSGNVPLLYFDNAETVDYVKVDGAKVSSSRYSVNARRGYIEFDSDYLDGLQIGTYTVKVFYEDGGSDTFTISIKSNNSTTYDYTYTKGTANTLSMYVGNTTYVPYEVTIGNYKLSSTEFTASNGYLYLNVSRLNSLATGTYTVVCNFTNGSTVRFTLRIVDNTATNIVTPRTVNHTKGSVFTTTHTYNYEYVPTYITVDGSTLNSSEYTVNTTTRTITLMTGFMNSLSSGTHSMRVYFADGKYDTVSLVISDDAQITSYIFDKTFSSSYYRNLSVTGIVSSPTLVMVGNNIMPVSYYGYNSSTQEVVLFKEYFSNLATGEYTVVISYGNSSRTVKVVIQQSTDSATFVYDKNTASINHKDITLTGNISNTNLQVFVRNRQLNPSEYTYNSGSVTIHKDVFDSLENGTCYIGITSSSANASAVVQIIDTTT